MARHLKQYKDFSAKPKQETAVLYIEGPGECKTDHLPDNRVFLLVPRGLPKQRTGNALRWHKLFEDASSKIREGYAQSSQLDPRHISARNSFCPRKAWNLPLICRGRFVHLWINKAACGCREDGILRLDSLLLTASSLFLMGFWRDLMIFRPL